jgi:hypothetical protein
MKGPDRTRVRKQTLGVEWLEKHRWTILRQQQFLQYLAETGNVSARSIWSARAPPARFATTIQRSGKREEPRNAADRLEQEAAACRGGLRGAGRRSWGDALSNSRVKSIEAGRRGWRDALPVAAKVAAIVIDRAMRGELFHPSGDLRNKISKPDTVDGWQTIRKYATENVPLSVFLHQRHYGGAFRQLLDATSGRGGVLGPGSRRR